MVNFSFEAFPIIGRTDGLSAGDIVAGLLTVNFEQRMIIKGIKATVVGRTKHSFSQSRTRYTMSEEHFNCSLYFLCDSENGHNVVAEQKAYQFPVLFTLPPGIPGSFKGSRGSVEYSLAVEVMKGLFALNPSKKFHLAVHGVIDLNHFRIPEISSRSFGLDPAEEALSALYSILNPDAINWLSLPTEVTTEKRFWKLYDMKLTFTIAKTGFVLGENVHFKAVVTNNVSSSIYLSFRIFQEIKYVFTKHMDRKEEEDYCSVFQYEGPVVGPQETTTWNVSDGEIKMPPLPLTNLGGGSIIGINYCAQVILKTRGLWKLVGSIPIFIGTTPLENAEEAPLSHSTRLIRSTSFANYCGFFEKLIMFFIIVAIISIFPLMYVNLL